MIQLNEFETTLVGGGKVEVQNVEPVLELHPGGTLTVEPVLEFHLGGTLTVEPVLE